MAAFFLTLLASLPGFADARRLALVVGNDAYDTLPPLNNAVADANAMARTLRTEGFEVTLLTDVGTEVFEAVLDTFARQSEGAEAVLFYYAGHAFQMEGVNHLVPISARIDSADSARAQTWTLDSIAARLKGGTAQLIVFLDACRTNPLPAGVEAGGQGLAQFDGGAGTFVAFATRPGAPAWDGGTGGSPFTAALVRRIPEPGQSISDLMIEVRNEVQTATGGAQVPWDQSSLRQQFYFAGRDDPAPDGAAALPAFEVVDSAVTVGGPGGTPAAAPVPVAPAAPVVLAQVAGLDLPRLSPLGGETRGLPVLTNRAAATAEAAPRIAGLEPVARIAPLPEAIPAAEPAPAPQASAALPVADTPPPRFSTPEDLARATQEELKRIGCYAATVDGDWGNGSARALGRYYAATGVKSDETMPTEALYDTLRVAPEKTCAPEKASVPVPKKSAPATKKSDAPAKKAQQKTQKKADPAPAAKSEKKGVTCTFIVVAIVCK